MWRRQFGGILDAHDPFACRRHRAQHRRQQRRLAGAGAAGHQERQPGRDDVAHQCPRPVGAIAPAAINAARSWVAGRSTRKRQAGAADRDRRQDGVQPDGSAAGADPGQTGRPPTAARRRDAGRRPTPAVAPIAAPRPRRRTEYRAAPQTVSIVDPHRVGCGDQDVGRAVGDISSGSRMPGTGQLGLQHPKIAQHLGVTEHSAGLGPDRVRPPLGAKRRRISVASRSRTRSISEPLMPPGYRSAGSGAPAARPAPGGPPRPAPSAGPTAGRRARAARPGVGCGFIDASSGRPAMSATSLGPQSARRRAPHHQPEVGIDRGQHRSQRRRSPRTPAHRTG